MSADAREISALIAKAIGDAEIRSQRRALTKQEAAHSLGVSVDHFDRHIQPYLRVVYSGRRRLIPVAELDRWLSENAQDAVEP
jgi:excisionase family DNA binding protein